MVFEVGSDREVFDSDFHLTESFSQVIEHMSDPYRSIYLRGSENIEHRSPFPDAGWFSPDLIGKRSVRPTPTREHVEEALEEYDIDYVLAQPSAHLHLGMVQHNELSTAVANAYNEWVLEEITDPDRGIYASMIVAPQRPKNAAAEIRNRQDEKDFIAVLVPSGGVNPPLGNPRYQPIYEAAEEAGLPVVLHNAVTSIMTGFPMLYQGFSRQLTCHAVSHPMQHMAHLADMIFQGIPVRYPDLNVVVQEGGVGWVPFMMRRLDNEYLNHRDEAAMLEKLPSEYIREQFFFTTQPFEGQEEPAYLSYVTELIGAENLLFSSDYPHIDFDNPGAVLSRLEKVDDEKHGAIAAENAKELYGVQNV